MNLTDLQAFVRVVEDGSFTAAAETLGVPKSTISRRVARLEDDLGMTLLHRAGRTVEVTDRGRLLHGRTAPAIQEISDAEEVLEECASTPRGLLRLTAPHDLGTTDAFALLLGDFVERYPEIELEVDLSARNVDLIGEGFDIAFRPHGGTVSAGPGLMARSVGTLETGIYASPAYLEAHGSPDPDGDLSGHRQIAHTAAKRAGWWADGSNLLRRVEPVIVANTFSLVRTLCVRGVGLAGLPTFVGEPEVQAGRLVRLVPDFDGAIGRVSILWPESRYVAPRVRAFLDFVGERVEGRGLFGIAGDEPVPAR